MKLKILLLVGLIIFSLSVTNFNYFKNFNLFSDEYLPEEFIKSIGENIDSALTNVIKNYDIEFQMRESHRILKAQYDQINGNIDNLLSYNYKKSHSAFAKISYNP